jgi:hypothetical protein
MTKNPILNALAAGTYITIISFMMNWGTKMAPKGPSFMAPIAVISLFTLSAAVMGYIFCYKPIQLYFEGKKKQAVTIFLQTVLVFGFLTVIALTLLFSGILK